MSEIFAKLIEKKEEKNSRIMTSTDPAPQEIKDENIPISLYEQRFHKPFVTEVMNLKSDFFSKLDKEGMQQLRNIDKFILEYLNEHEMEDTKEAYREVFNQITESLGLNHAKSAIKVNKLNALIFLKKLLT